jgi:hypothetical protein
MAIVGDLEQFQAPILDEYLQRRRTGIHRIFNQFFQSMHGGNDDFPCGNFIYDILLKRLDSCVSQVFCRSRIRVILP